MIPSEVVVRSLFHLPRFMVPVFVGVSPQKNMLGPVDPSTPNPMNQLSGTDSTRSAEGMVKRKDTWDPGKPIGTRRSMMRVGYGSKLGTPIIGWLILN